MTRLIATLGTSPGAVYETVLNLCRGSYDCGSEDCHRISINTITLITTTHPRVILSGKVSHILLECSEALFPPDDPRRLPCSIDSVNIIHVDVKDIDSKSAYEKFKKTIASTVSSGDMLDITGGRASMAVAAVLATHVEKKLHDVGVYTTIIPSELQRATMSAAERLNNFNIDKLYERFKKEGCNTLKDTHEIAKVLRDLVTGRAQTIQLHP